MRVRILLCVSLLVVACRPSAGDAPTSTSLEAAPPVSTTDPTTTQAPSASDLPATTQPPTASSTPTTRPTTTTTHTATTTLPPKVSRPPGWLGENPLPTGDDGQPVTPPTPPELVDRRFASADHLPPPPDDAFHSSIEPVPSEVLDRSTWAEDCPVTREELAYVTVTFEGFDRRPHTGELLVAESEADAVVSAFRQIYQAGFPIEAMRIASRADLEAEPTGDGNVTSAFVCRPVTGGQNWSEHAYGLAIDINPFHNPYVRGDRVLPELASAYLDRDRNLPGTIHEGDVVTGAFGAIGWEWGGNWSSLKDYQHFSATGR